DVINLSLGAPLGFPNDPSAISVNNAAVVGIIVATSAGNAGDTPYVTGAPGVASSAIATAATTPGGRFYSKFTVREPASLAGEYPSIEGSGPVTLQDTGAIEGELVPATPLDGCSALTNTNMSGNIALIIRGTCDFNVKYLNAQAAGARAIVVFNDGTSSTRVDPIIMGGISDVVTIPGAMISYTIGSVLATTQGVEVTLLSERDPAREDQIATFSSRGPSHGGSGFRPARAAPGDAIASVGVGTGTGAAIISGTSMASPHTAGAAALLREKHPHLDQ